MRLRQLTPVRVDDVTLWVALDWGALKRLQKEQRALSDDEDAGLSFIEGKLVELVRRVDGLEAEDGTPVSALTPEVVDALPPMFLRRAFEGLFSVGEAESGPLAASSDR